MKVATMLAFGLLLTILACGTADHNDLPHDECTPQQLAVLSIRVDEMCFENINTTATLLDTYYTILGTGQDPDQGIVNQLEGLLDEVCTDSCIGGYLDLFSTCFISDDPEFSAEVESFKDLCLSNGNYFCPLAPTRITNQVALDTAFVCISGAVGQEVITCTPTCKDAVEAVVEEAGCCATTNFEIVENVTIADYYAACGIQDPGECELTLLEGDLDGNDIVSGDCTRDQLAEFYATYDYRCENKTSQLDPLTEAYSDSLERLSLDQEAADSLDNLLPEVCTSTCLGALSDLYSVCTPEDFGATPEELNAGIRLCAHNGDYFCILAPIKDDDLNLVAFASALSCSVQWLSTDDCTSACKDLTKELADDFGCCTTSILGLFLSPNATTGEYYSACDIDGTRECSTPFEDDGDSGAKKAAAGSLALMAVLVALAL